MTDRASRRALLRAAGLGVAGGLAGCRALTDVFPRSGDPRDRPQSSAGAVTGRVTDADDAPLSGATVTAMGAGRETLATAETDREGRFEVATSRPAWLRVRATDHKERVVAAAPGRSYRIALAGADGTATLSFGGDVMFARRFYEDSTDPLNPREAVDPGSLADHRRVLSFVEPLLASADVASVNLETPLTTTDWRHPTKRYRYASHPVAGQALVDAGVDYAALGNNHAFDALTPGLEETVETLDGAGVAHSGAGLSAADAWEPATVEASGLTVAYLSCTTLVGGDEEPHWSADRDERAPATVQRDGESLTIPPGAGVAEATTGRLADRVRAAGDADVVVVQIHGGDPYRPRPTEAMRELTEAAARAGADLVVNHHPHVVGGVERVGSAVVAWTLGNLVFDQTLWPTFPTYLLTAEVTAGGVQRVHVDPLLLENFVPRGVVGKPNRHVAWRTAGLSSPTVAVTDTGLTAGVEEPDGRRVRRDLAGDALFARESGRVTGVASGSVRLGRDLLPTGTFESVDVDAVGYDAPLWRYGHDARATGASFGYGGSGGFRLDRVGGNSSRAILSNSRRIPVDGPLTLACRYRTRAAEGLDLEVGWYADTADPRFSTDRWDLAGTGGEWDLFSRELTPPQASTHLNLLFALEPPVGGRRTAFVDDVRLVAWADEGATAGREFDHLRVDRDATVEFAPGPDGEVTWDRVDRC